MPSWTALYDWRRWYNARVETPEPKPLSRTELRTDLEAALAARQELGPEIEDDLIGAFLDRLQRQIDVRVQQQVAQQIKQSAARRDGSVKRSEGILAISLALAIPLVVLAGIWGGTTAIVAVIAAVVLLNVLHMYQGRGL